MPAKVKDKLTQRAVDGAKPGEYLWDSEVRGFGLRVAPGGTRTFIFQYRTKAIDPVTGKLHQGRMTLGRADSKLSVEDARTKAKAMARDVDDNKNPSAIAKAARTPVKVLTLQDLADLYTDVWAAERGLRPKTVAEAKRLLAPVLKAHGDKPVASFTKADIETLHAAARTRKPRKAKKVPKAEAKADKSTVPEAAGRGPAPAAALPPAIYQANRLLAVLSKLFALAVEREWPGVSVNPCQKVKKYQENARKRSLSPNEVGRLLLACDASPQQWKGAENAVRLLVFTGARLREVLNAEWKQFDLEEGVWEKPSSHTKTKIVHRVRLVGPVLDRLKVMREADPLGRFLFPGKSPKGKAPTQPRADLNKPWQWLIKEADLTNVRIHDLRRTTSRIMASSGASAQIVGAVLGHTQASTTARYISIDMEPQAEAMRLAGEKMQALKADAKARAVASLEEARAGKAQEAAGER